MNKKPYHIIIEWRQPSESRPSRVIINRAGGMLTGAAHRLGATRTPDSSTAESLCSNLSEGSCASVGVSGATNRLAGPLAAGLGLLLLALVITTNGSVFFRLVHP